MLTNGNSFLNFLGVKIKAFSRNFLQCCPCWVSCTAHQRALQTPGSRPLACFNNYIKGQQLLCCTIPQKYKAAHCHTISLTSGPEKEPGGGRSAGRSSQAHHQLPWHPPTTQPARTSASAEACHAQSSTRQQTFGSQPV